MTGFESWPEQVSQKIIEQELYEWLEQIALEATLMQYFENPNQRLQEIEDIAKYIVETLWSESMVHTTIDPNVHAIQIQLANWQERSFDLLDIRWEQTSLNELRMLRESQNLEIVQYADKLERTLDALNLLFIQNADTKWYYKFWWKNSSELNVHDVLETEEYWAHIKWKNIHEIANEVRKQIAKIDQILLSSWANLSQDKIDAITQSKERYLAMTMWVWDIYEWWAAAFQKTADETDALLIDILKQKDSQWMLDYMVEIHTAIDQNKKIDVSADRANKLLTQSLASNVLTHFIENKVDDVYIIELIKIVTGRHVVDTKTYMQRWETIEIHDYANNKYRNTELAKTALNYLIQKPEWVLSRLDQSESFEMNDELVWERTASEVFSDMSEVLNTFKQKYPEVSIESYIALWDMWDMTLEQLFNLSDESYNELNIENKILITYLAKIEAFLQSSSFQNIEILLEQQRKQRESINTLQQEQAQAVWVNHWVEQYSAGYSDIDWFLAQEIPRIYKQAGKDVANLFDEQFSSELTDVNTWSKWKSASDFWLTSEIDNEIMSLYNDIHWVWFDVSDTWVAIAKWAWTIWAVIVSSIAIGWPLALAVRWWVIAQWASIWVVSWPIANWMTWKWYDTDKEMWVDVSTDALLNGFFWAVGWWVAHKINPNGSLNVFSNGWMNLNNAVFAGDLVVWIWAEFARMWYIDKQFHWESLFEHAWKNFQSNENFFIYPEYTSKR